MTCGVLRSVWWGVTAGLCVVDAQGLCFVLQMPSALLTVGTAPLSIASCQLPDGPTPTPSGKAPAVCAVCCAAWRHACEHVVHSCVRGVESVGVCERSAVHLERLDRDRQGWGVGRAQTTVCALLPCSFMHVCVSECGSRPVSCQPGVSS